MASSFSVEDIRLLEKTINIRERMIDNLFAPDKDLPTKARDIDSYTNLLESVDRSVFAKAKISIEESNGKLQEETKGVLTELLLSLHKGEIPKPVAPVDSSVENIPTFQSTGMDIHNDVLIPKIDNVNLSDVVPDEH